MKSMAERKNLELSVRDFGPIARAEIDLRPLTVFVGPSNTGKSYLAVLIYALHKFFHRHIYDTRVIGSIPDPYMSDGRIGELIHWIDTLHAQFETMGASPEGTHTPIPDSISTNIRPFLSGIESIGAWLKEEIARGFGIADTNKLIRHSSKNGAHISVKPQLRYQSEVTEPFGYQYVITRNGDEFVVSIPDSTPLFLGEIDKEEIEDLRERTQYIRNALSQTELGEDQKVEFLFLMEHLVRLVESYIRYPLNQPAHYLPSDRAGVMHTHRLAVGSLIQRASYAGVQREESLPLISGVIADFLRQLTELDSKAVTWGGGLENGAELAGRIERKMLKGGVRYENSVMGYPIFSYKPDGWKEDIPLMNTSSMVSEIGAVVLYLRHVVQQGETLIIEEPESHLHPAMQVEFTRQLAAVVRAGVRVIITTHSEWVLDELTNLVRLWELPESRRKGIGGADSALDPKQVGVWLFEPKRRPRGSVVKEIPFDEEFGGFRSGFDEVAMGTYNDYAAISNRKERSTS